ncbi:unnamed protein product [Didymodactylos carnosus]|uniref:Uncharacterized protein n=1 Tax=Didymodactylos carnosus TaxID=1234261 RepID=A0A815KHY5_9BILA|nr:unnamed protein product [Didymodactylos carnosus]CAF4285857.1 unnamed protein product [Didymodactylos carnosus]
MLAQAIDENLIVCTGKTYISVMLIKELSASTNLKLCDDGKRTIFLVKQVTLVHQQGDYISMHTGMSVGKYYGELDIELWDKSKWDNEFETHQVLVMTSQIFLDILTHTYVSLSQVNLLIFDECHHATGADSYAVIMNEHYDNTSGNMPRILGLTASITSRKIKAHKLEKEMQQLELTLKSRIESGSSREESRRHGTSAVVKYIPCIPYKLNCNDSVKMSFEILNKISLEIEKHHSEYRSKRDEQENQLSEVMLFTDYRHTNMINYNEQSACYMQICQSQSITVPKLKRHIDNIKHMGNDLGLMGLYLACLHLKTYLKDDLNNQFSPMNFNKSQELFMNVYNKIELMTDTILYKLIEENSTNYHLLYSEKVCLLLEQIVEQYALTLSFETYDCSHSPMKCIIFVERICTAILLSELLENMCQIRYPEYKSIKSTHIAGTKSFGIKDPMNAKRQRQIINDFRSGTINCLIATAVVEEGLDIPQCNLVFRFNKPNNFCSYMQSKGRARAKQNASFIILMSSDDHKAMTEYREYEEIEEILQSELYFRSSSFDDDIEDATKLPPYVTENGVVIDATRAVRLIYEYCAILGHGQIFPPRILFHGNGPYSCILSMPANCPVRDDVISMWVSTEASMKVAK